MKACLRPASSEAIRISQARAMLAPLPAAIPLIRAMTGFSMLRIRRMIGWYFFRRWSPSEGCAPPAYLSFNPETSSPAENARPAPVIIRHRVKERYRSEEHTSELQSHHDLVCRLLLEKKKKNMSEVQSSFVQ